jgi:hypothetical protein
MTILTEENLRQWHDAGFFILRDVVDCETVAELRGVVKNILLTPDPAAAGALTDSEPNQPAETRSFAGRMARYRKHNSPGTTFFPLMWHECIAGAWADVALEMAPYLGSGSTGDVLAKFSSSFVKQPSGGAATPWHQSVSAFRTPSSHIPSVHCGTTLTATQTVRVRIAETMGYGETETRTASQCGWRWMQPRKRMGACSS